MHGQRGQPGYPLARRLHAAMSRSRRPLHSLGGNHNFSRLPLYQILTGWRCSGGTVMRIAA